MIARPWTHWAVAAVLGAAAIPALATPAHRATHRPSRRPAPHTAAAVHSAPSHVAHAAKPAAVQHAAPANRTKAAPVRHKPTASRARAKPVHHRAAPAAHPLHRAATAR